MSIEERRLQVEEEKLLLERQVHADTQALERLKLAAETKARRWGQLATLLPIFALVLGFFLNQWAEREKRASQAAEDVQRIQREVALQRHTERLRFVERQLSELYYPIKIRLERDNAIWQVSMQNPAASANFKLAADIESRLLLPNHEEVMEILKTKFQLLVNEAEVVDVAALTAEINLYQRHVTLYRALRESKDNRYPHSICTGCEYPDGFEKQITARIVALEAQRRQLVQSMPVSAAN